MENLTHTLVGAALAQSGLKRATPFGTATLLLAANIPDIDVVSGAFGPLAYLEWHRGLTHSLVGFPILATLLAIAVYLFSRRRARFWPLLGLSLIGTATHPLLDYTNAYGWRPFLPWSDRWFFLDVAFVADPWIWLGLGGAVFLATSGTRARQLSWSLLFAVVTTVVMLAPTGIVAKLLWLLFAAVIILVRIYFARDEQTRRQVNLGSLVACGVYLGVMASFHMLALYQLAEVAQVAISPNEQVVELNAMPTEINPNRWRSVVATEEAFYMTDLYLFGSSDPTLERIPREQGNLEAIEAARKTQTVERFLKFARFPAVKTVQTGETMEVGIEDLRFAGLTNRFRVRVRLDSNLRPLDP